MLPRPSLILRRYGCAPVSIALAIGLRLLLDPVVGDQLPYVTLFLAVLLTAGYGGFGPASIAIVLGTIGADYFLLPPRGTFRLHGADQMVGLALYIATSLGIAVLGGLMRAAKLRAESGARAMQHQAALLDQIHDAVLTWDWNGPITYWNRGAERLYGFPRTEALHRVSHDLLGTQAPNGLQEVIHSLDRDGAWEGELEQTTQTGQKVIVESRMVLIRGTERAYVLEANRDISPRKKAQAELRQAKEQLEIRVQERTQELAEANESLEENDQRLRLLVAGVKGYAIFMLDPHGNVATWNHGAEGIKGYSAEEIVGQHFSHFYPPEDIQNEKPERELRTAAADGHYQEEGWRMRKDGSRFWANVLITAMRDSHGRLRGFSKVTRDMTEPRREEAALKETQARMGGIIDSAMDAIISINDEQNIVLFNAAAEKMFQCPAVEALGQPITMFLPARFREYHHRHVRGFGATGVTSRSMRSLGVLSGLRADGEEFPIEASISQLEVEAQKQYTVILRDITERKRAEESLRKSEAQLQTVVESLDEGVVISDLTGKLVHFNRAALAMHGFASMEECLRREPDFADTFELRRMDGTLWQLDQWPLSRILRGEKLRDMEVRIRRLEGGWERVFNYGGTLVHDANGKLLMAVVTIADITERKRAADEIRQLNAELEVRVAERTAQLEAANKELEAFSYSVSHDLRAPLRAVDGFSQVLMEDFGPQLPEQGRHYLNTIRAGAQRMGSLIDDLLMFARLSRQPLRKRTVDTGTMVSEALEELASQRQDRQMEMRISDLAPCEGDRALLKQVWVNLLSNALKYTRLREPAVVEIGCTARQGEAVVYFVRDNGTGFDMQYAHKLFGVFQRLHRAEDFEGTGVGLAIVQRVVQRHGGRIWAEAVVDQGATFYFTVEGGPPA